MSLLVGLPDSSHGKVGSSPLPSSSSSSSSSWLSMLTYNRGWTIGPLVATVLRYTPHPSIIYEMYASPLNYLWDVRLTPQLFISRFMKILLFQGQTHIVSWLNKNDIRLKHVLYSAVQLFTVFSNGKDNLWTLYCSHSWKPCTSKIS
jgi:hypothetical protein